MGEAPGRSLEGPDEIQPPDREWPRDGDGLEGLRGQVSLAREELAPLTGTDYLGSVGDRRRPVEALPEGIADEGPWRSVVAAGSGADVPD